MKFSFAIIATFASLLVNAAPLVIRGATRTDRTSVSSRQAWASRTLAHLQQSDPYGGNSASEMIAAYERRPQEERLPFQTRFLQRELPAPVVSMYEKLIQTVDENEVVNATPYEIKDWWSQAWDHDKEQVMNQLLPTFTHQQKVVLEWAHGPIYDVPTALFKVQKGESEVRDEFYESFWTSPHTRGQLEIVESYIIQEKGWDTKTTVGERNADAFWQLPPRFRDILYEISVYYYGSLGQAMDDTF